MQETYAQTGWVEFHDFSDFIMGELCGVLVPLFLHQTVSALWAFVLFNTLLKTIMRDADESPSLERGRGHLEPLARQRLENNRRS